MKSTTHHIASLTLVQSPLPSPPGIGVTTGQLLCGTNRHLLSPVPRMATKINLRSANYRLVTVRPDKLYSLLIFTHTHTHHNELKVLRQQERTCLLCIRYLRDAQKMRSTTHSHKQTLQLQSQQSHAHPANIG